MEGSKYTYFGEGNDPKSLVIKMQHKQPWTLDSAVSNWSSAWISLPPGPEGIRQYCNKPQVAEDPNQLLGETETQ